MTDALRYEWTRIRTIRSTWWLTGITVVVGTALGFLIAWGVSTAFAFDGAPRGQELAAVGPMVVGQFSGEGAPFFVPFVVALIGVFAWGHEYRHGMIRATLTAVPSRTHAWVAKYLVVGVWAALVTLVTLLLTALMAWLWLRDNGVPVVSYDVGRIIVKATVYTVLFTWIAAAVASVLRHQAAALVLVFLWPLALESVLTLIPNIVPGLRDLAPLARFLPFNAGVRMLTARDFTGTFFGEPLSPWGGFLVFAAFAVVLMVLSSVLFRRRDA